MGRTDFHLAVLGQGPRKIDMSQGKKKKAASLSESVSTLADVAEDARMSAEALNARVTDLNANIISLDQTIGRLLVVFGELARGAEAEGKSAKKAKRRRGG